jgi:Ca-activated chloride channel homolog
LGARFLRLDTRCLAESNGGLSITADDQDQLIDALKKTLDCPMLSQNALP